MTDDIPARLLAAIEETERIARAAIQGNWTARNYGGGAATASTAEHIARQDPQSTLTRCSVDQETLREYTITVRLRDEAADRLRAQGEHKDRGDLDTWCRTETETGILLPVIERMARTYGLNTEAAIDG